MGGSSCLKDKEGARFGLLAAGVGRDHPIESRAVFRAKLEVRVEGTQPLKATFGDKEVRP